MRDVHRLSRQEVHAIQNVPIEWVYACTRNSFSCQANSAYLSERFLHKTYCIKLTLTSGVPLAHHEQTSAYAVLYGFVDVLTKA
jgi:hypothetical protein